MEYNKLSNLVNDVFTIENIAPYVWKMWDQATKHMVTSEKYQEGFSKKYPVTTDKGILDLGSGQLGSLLECVFKDGQADLNGKTFSVKSNGKTGMDIRYFFSEAKVSMPSEIKGTDEPGEQVTDEIPF